MEKYIGTYHKSSPFIKNLLKKQICSFEILWQNPPPVCRFSKICHWTVTYMCLQNSPWFADLLKSATGQLLTCACRIPPSMQIFSNLPLDSYLHVLAEIPPQFADLLKSATGQLLTCACRIPPSMQIFKKSATGQLPTCAFRNPPKKKSATGQLLTGACRFPPCRFSQICHLLQIYWISACRNPNPPLTCPCFVPVWEIYSAILLLCSCLYFTQWRTTMNISYMETSCELLKIQQEISCLQMNKQQIEQRIKDKKEQYEDIAARNLQYLKIIQWTKGVGHYSPNKCGVYPSTPKKLQHPHAL